MYIFAFGPYTFCIDDNFCNVMVSNTLSSLLLILLELLVGCFCCLSFENFLVVDEDFIVADDSPVGGILLLLLPLFCNNCSL